MRPPLLPHKRIVRAFERAGFRIIRQGRHISMWNGEVMITVPRCDPVNPWTLKGIIRDAGLTIDEFKDLVRVRRGAEPRPCPLLAGHPRLH